MVKEFKLKALSLFQSFQAFLFAGTEVLNLGSFTLLPQHVVRLILAREELRAEEFTKFQAALMWSKKYCDSNPVSCCCCFITVD